MAIETVSERESDAESEQAVAASWPRPSVTWWCSCGCCVQMDREEESLCCK